MSAVTNRGGELPQFSSEESLIKNQLPPEIFKKVLLYLPHEDLKPAEAAFYKLWTAVEQTKFNLENQVLPLEIIHNVLLHLPRNDLKSTKAVCRQWRALSDIVEKRRFHLEQKLKFDSILDPLLLQDSEDAREKACCELADLGNKEYERAERSKRPQSPVFDKAFHLAGALRRIDEIVQLRDVTVRTETLQGIARDLYEAGFHEHSLQVTNLIIPVIA